MKHFTWQGETYDRIPNPLQLENGECVSPVSEALFESLGGEITEDSELTPEQKFRTNLNDYLAALEAKARELGLNITVSDFYAAASTMFSTDLIQWARDLNVPDEMIAEVRNQILTYVADASRLGLTWDDIFAVPPNNNNQN